MTEGVALFGATGSIGESTLSVIAAHPERFHLEVVSAHRSIDKLIGIIERFAPRHAILTDQSKADEFMEKLPKHFNGSLAFGEHSLTEAASATDVDVVMAAIVGGAGLVSTYAAVSKGKRVCLANKEALVMGGDLMMAEAQKQGAVLLPIDSEHNAMFQCLPESYVVGQPIAGLKQLVLTCSGGPFREWTPEAMSQATPDQAVAHPNWSMGQKISVDSATLMNKGLELIEATYLFGVSEQAIEVVIHPESTVHSLVEFVDGSMLAQLGSPDMRIPIAHALGFPERLDLNVERLSLTKLANLHFEAVNHQAFPALALARQASADGGDRPIILNAANEIAVQAFLKERIRFTEITELVSDCLNQIDRQPISSIEDVLSVDTMSRQIANHWILERA
ncbi:1-deoxy-D-xylulose-5-phosphate reductoisomerase [Litoricolaceae bacterium]|nr:1-deoxy-D-xylulose-5-phosphate reductoisomerase [Litorivicinaceae bacterium]